MKLDMSDAANTAAREREVEVLQQIKQVHAAGGTPLIKRQAIEFVTRHVNMGSPEPITKARGRKPSRARTQYELALARRRDLHRRLVKLPILRNGTGHIDREDIERRLEACRAQKIPRHKWVSTTCDSLHRDRKPCDERTVRRIKKAWEAR
ncbi:hypothetical protein [Burkholderia ambifaria]|uniref:hypothetical protein n=1 Tax=Burkholderia ambifaria TaxID=152480 RepID=UPI002FE29A27